MRRDGASFLRYLNDGAIGWEAWWPAGSDFERVVGAILIQRTRWENVDRAMAALRSNGLLDPESLASCPPDRLEELVRPAGFYRQKAAYLNAVAGFFSTASLDTMPTEKLREELLALPGVGDETADVLLLYVAGRPRFVVDAYARRMLSCLDINTDYEALQSIAGRAFGDDLEAYRRCHAAIVELGKRYCNRKACEMCPVKRYLG